MGRTRSNNPENLPPNLYKKGCSYYAVTNGIPRKWIRLSKCKETALAMYSNLFSNDSNFKKDAFEDCDKFVMYEGRAVGIKSFYATELIKTLYSRSKAGAKARGIEYALTIEDIEVIYARSKGYCELTGLAFFMMRDSKEWKSNPWVPSIDRVSSSGGYSLENCRLVCNAVNRALGEWGENVFASICKGYSSKALCRER